MPAVSLSRRATAGVLLLIVALGVLWLAGTASASAVVTFKPGFSPNQLGEGTVWSSEMTFSGTEYDGSVAPLTKLMVHLPAGVGGTSAGFPVCEQTTLETDGPAGCPSGSMAGPEGSISLEGKIGPNEIKETGILDSFFAPDEKLLFFIQATAPLNVEIVAQASYVSDTTPYGRVLTLELPLIEPVPGAPYLSTTALNLYLGSSRVEHSATINSVTVPSTCPESGFPWAADPTFYEESGPPLQVTYIDLCPGADDRGPTTTTLTASNTTPVVGEGVTYTATVTSTEGGPAPSGDVAFWDDGVVLNECDAQPLSPVVTSSSTATCQVTYPASGSHQMTASYEGDLDYDSSGSSTVTVAVQPSTSIQPGSGNTGSSSTPGTTGGVPGSGVVLPSSHPVVAKPLTRSQLLAKALKLCRREKPRSKRKACEAHAKKRYKVKKAKKKGKQKKG